MVAVICKFTACSVYLISVLTLLIVAFRSDGILSFSAVSLAVSVPRLDKGKQRIAVWIWMGCIIVVFSFLMNLFKIKNGGYPFRLLF